MKKRVAQYMMSASAQLCHGKRLRRESLSVKFAGMDIAELSRLPLKRLAEFLRPYADGTAAGTQEAGGGASREGDGRAADCARSRWRGWRCLLTWVWVTCTLERSTPTLSPGELQRLRLATQVRSNLFGVVYVLDEPSAGLHPADTEALLVALDRLKARAIRCSSWNMISDVIRHADWIVDIGPAAGEHGGHVLYSGPPQGLRKSPNSQTAAASV